MTQLEQEFGKKGLVVIGIDGFGDSKENVKTFVDATDAGYRILLNGNKVASDQYFVTAYPTTFLIDRKGVVVKRTIGFDPDDFAELKNELIRLLK